MKTLDVVIPVLNEEAAIQPSTERLREFLLESVPHRCRVVIVDNGSTDKTKELGEMLAARYDDVSYLRLEERGRGRALRAAWLGSDADIVSYMDVDLSTNLRAFPSLIAPLADGTFDVAIGSRLKKGAAVTRQWKREVISRCYNLLVRVLFPHKRFSDAQCGFKALSRKAVDELVPSVEDRSWFFDTELLIRADQLGYAIFEVPVDWVEDLDSRVNILKTAWDDIKGLIRVRRSRLRASPDEVEESS